MSGSFESMMSGIFGGIGGLEQDKADAAALRQLQDTPGFSDQKYGEMSYLGDLQPQQYGTPEAAQYQTVSEDPRTRDYQMQALARMQGLADQSAGSAEALGRYNAVSDANAVAAQQNAAIRNQMAMRGQGGAGMEFVLQQQAGQNAANRAQAGGLNAAQQAALQRLMGTQGVMAGASNIRGMDADVASRNADIINRFNMANTGMRNQTNMANTDMANAAAARNLGTRQTLAGANTGIRNQTLDRDDRNRLTNMNALRQKFGMHRGITQGRGGEIGQVAGGFGAGADAMMSMASGGMG